METKIEEIRIEKFNEDEQKKEFLIGCFNKKLGWFYDSMTITKTRSKKIRMICKCGETLIKDKNRIYCKKCGFDNSKGITCDRCYSNRTITIKKNVVKCLDCGKKMKNGTKEKIYKFKKKIKLKIIIKKQIIKNFIDKKFKRVKNNLEERKEKIYKKRSEKLYDKCKKIYQKTKAMRQKYHNLICKSIFQNF